MKKIIIFTAIIVLGSVLRFFELSKYPEGVHIDEASVAYNAYSVAKTGRDQFGKMLPFIFESENDYKLPMHLYITAVFIKLLGFNQFVVRLVCFLAGILGILLIKKICFEITRSERISLLSTFLLAISPWQFYFSRGSTSLEVISSILIVCLAFYNFLKNKPGLFFIFGLMSLFTYRTATVFTIIFYAIIFGYLFLKEKNEFVKRKRMILLWGIILAVFLLFLPTYLKRFESLSFLKSDELKLFSLINITEDGNKFRNSDNLFVVRVFHNKILDALIINQRNFWSQLDFSHMFFAGFFPPGPTILFCFEIVFLLVFLSHLSFLFKKYPKIIFLVIFLIISYFPSSTAVDFQNFGREAQAIVGFVIMIAIGIFIFIKLFSKRFKVPVKIAIISLYAFFLGYFQHQFFMHIPYRNPWSKNFGLEKLVKHVESNKQRYTKVVFGSDIYTLYAYFSQIDPSLLHSKIYNNIDLWKQMVMKNIDDKFVSDNRNCDFVDGEENVLYVCFGSKIPLKSKIIKVYRFRDGQPSYILITYDRNGVMQNLPDRVEYY